MKLRYIAAGIILLTFFTVFSCKSKRNEPSKSDTVDVSYSDTTLPPVTLSLSAREWQVVCGKTFTLARCANGEILFTGNCAQIFREKERLTGAAYITAYDNTAAGIMPDGTVCVIGKNRKIFAETTLWKNIADVCIGENFIAGLSEDGTLYACGNDDFGCNDAFGITNVKAIAAGKNLLAAVFSDGSVEIFGSLKDKVNTENWKNVEEIACGDDFVIAVNKDGEVLNYGAEFADEWANVHSLQACGSAAAALTDTGLIISGIDADIAEELGADAEFSLSEFNIAAVRNDGSVFCAGDNDNLQCEVDWWRLGADIKDGYITGFDSATKTDVAVGLTEKACGKAVFVCDENKQPITPEYVGTGMYVCDTDGNEIGCILIYGDVNGDGLINAWDAMQIEKTANGTEKLTGAYEKAAHVLHYLPEVTAPSAEDADAVRKKSNGDGVIVQHLRNPYAADIIKYHNINSDTVGYIRVEGTQIDYPIMYADKYYYSNHDVYKHHSGIGSIYSIHSEYGKNNTVIGHNIRRSGRMFHGLHKIEDRGEKLLIFRNRVVNVTLYHEYSSWELFAVYETGPREPDTTQMNNYDTLAGFTANQIREWIDNQISRSTIDLGVEVSTDDTFLTMYTCGDEYFSDPNTQSRLYLFFRRVG